jgi:hypothetical protein
VLITGAAKLVIRVEKLHLKIVPTPVDWFLNDTHLPVAIKIHKLVYPRRRQRYFEYGNGGKRGGNNNCVAVLTLRRARNLQKYWIRFFKFET